jgi:hypothetical protein
MHDVEEGEYTGEAQQEGATSGNWSTEIPKTEGEEKLMVGRKKKKNYDQESETGKKKPRKLKKKKKTWHKENSLRKLDD